MRASPAVLALLAGLALAPAPWAQAAAAPAKPAANKAVGAGKSFGRDFTGIWEQDQGVLFTDPTKGAASGNTPGHNDALNPPPFTPEYAAKYKAIQDLEAKGIAANDPTANCSPPGMPRLMINPYPNEWIMGKNVVYMLTEYLNQARRIYLDGRKHPDPEETTPQFNGHSTGHWEGDTLVVETVNIRGDTPLQSTGVPRSDKMRVVERIRLIGPDKMEDQITMYDPVAFTRPYTSTRTYTRIKDYEIVDYVCTNNRFYVDEKGQTQIILPKQEN
jgi:hypothetical protein